VACVSLGTGALADTGDVLLVSGQGVNVRSQPSLEGQILLRVNRNRQVTEIERSGDWVRVEIDGTGGREGWIHGSLLVPVQGGASPTPASTPSDAPATTPSATPSATPTVTQAAEFEQPPRSGAEDAGDPAEPEVAGLREDLPGTPEPAAGPAARGSVERFRSNVEYLNNRARQVAGVALFTEVEPAGAGVVQVGTTDAWTTVPPAGQRSYLNTLYDRWVAAHDGLADVSVQILDDEGSVMMEKAGP
jgi:hypothetical protein